VGLFSLFFWGRRLVDKISVIPFIFFKGEKRKKEVDTYMLNLPFFTAMTLLNEDEKFKMSDE